MVSVVFTFFTHSIVLHLNIFGLCLVLIVLSFKAQIPHLSPATVTDSRHYRKPSPNCLCSWWNWLDHESRAFYQQRNAFASQPRRNDTQSLCPPHFGNRHQHESHPTLSSSQHHRHQRSVVVVTRTHSHTSNHSVHDSCCPDVDVSVWSIECAVLRMRKACTFCGSSASRPLPQQLDQHATKNGKQSQPGKLVFWWRRTR